jgi:hypothetical protein
VVDRSRDYLKSLQVVYSAGAPGVGKTTWARMALDHVPSSCVVDERFQPVLDRCIQRGWRYRICFGEDKLAADELQDPSLSIAARLLWQHVKYEAPRVFSIKTYDRFWAYLQHHRLSFVVADVLNYICGADVAPEDRMLLINLDEINVLFPTAIAAASPALVRTAESDYIEWALRHLLGLQLAGLGFVMPVLTATKALQVRQIIRLSGCSFREIPLPLLTAPYVADLVRDLHSRARAAVKSSAAAPSASAAASSSVATVASTTLANLQLQEQAAEPLPALLLHLLELMAGHPRFLEKLLFRLGRPNGAADVWSAATFVDHMAQLHSPVAPASAVMESWLGAVSNEILGRYAAFTRYLMRAEFVSIAPQLLGYTLFEWSVSREQVFSEQEYRVSVAQMEEDGVVFLTPRPSPTSVPVAGASVAGAAAASSAAVASPVVVAGGASISSADAYPVDLELRLVMPFLWVHVLYERHAANYASSVVQLPLVKTLTCRLSPAQNEELTLSVLALKCFCFAKRGRIFVSASELFGVPCAPDTQLRLPSLSLTLWPVVKLRHQVTAETWEQWHLQQVKQGDDHSHNSASASSPAAALPPPPRPHFFLNGEKAPFWDGCVLTDPPIFVQDKQSLVSREKVAQGKLPNNAQWADVEKEALKCNLSACAHAPLFLFCCDTVIIGDRPPELLDRVVLIDRDSHISFFGSALASRKAMCLSEVGTASAPH